MATKVLTVGGSGMLGGHITRGFLNNKSYSVSLLTRQGAKPGTDFEQYKSQGASILAADYEKMDTLVEAMRGQDIVVSTVGPAGLPEQFKLVEAAKAAGVRRFIPSDFGLDTDRLGDYQPNFLEIKQKVQEAVKASGMEWTFVYTSFFTETTITPFLGFDIDNATATIKGNGDSIFTLTSLSDIGTWLPEALKDPATKNASLRLAGEEMSFNKALALVEKKTGKKFSVTHVSPEELRAGVLAAPNPYAVFGDWLLMALSDGKGTIRDAWNKSSPLFADKPVITLEKYLDSR